MTMTKPTSEQVTFTAAGSGATLRNLVDKVREVVSVKDFGAAGDGVTDDTAAIQAAIAYGASQNVRIGGSGTYRVSSKIVINCAFDGSDMTILVYGTPAIALEVSTGSAPNPTNAFSLTVEREIILPSIQNMTKPTSGWAGQGIGIRYVNVQNMKITERLVRDFAIGVQHTAYSTGCGYNTVQGGFLLNNEVNRQLTTGNAGGFTNRWDLYGGRYFHFSAEGTAVTGCKHFDVTTGNANVINDINLFGASLEGIAEEFHADIGGAYVNFFGCRWESSAGIKVRFKQTSDASEGSANLILGGRGADAIVFTEQPGVTRNQVISRSGTWLDTATPTRIRNTGSANNAALLLFEAGGASALTASESSYSGFFAASFINGKRSTDAEPRVIVNFQNGRFLVGNGTAAPTAGMQSIGASGVQASGNWYFPNIGTSPAAVAGNAPLWFDETAGEFKFRRPDGTVRTITSS